MRIPGSVPFCGAISDDDIAAPLDKLVDHMRTCLAQDYDDPTMRAWFTRARKGDIRAKFGDTRHFVQWQLGLELPNDHDNKLLDAICNRLGDQPWCRAHLYVLNPHEALAYSWRTFCSLVKHSSAFLNTVRT